MNLSCVYPNPLSEEYKIKSSKIIKIVTGIIWSFELFLWYEQSVCFLFRRFCCILIGMNRWITDIHLSQDDSEALYYRMAFEEKGYQMRMMTHDNLLLSDAALVFCRKELFVLPAYHQSLETCVSRGIPMILVNAERLEEEQLAYLQKGTCFLVGDVSFRELDLLLHPARTEKKHPVRDKLINLLFAVLTIVFVCFLISAGMRMTPLQQQPQTKETAVETQMMERYGSCIVQVWSISTFGEDVYRGTGFLVSGDGAIVTNAHVVDHPSSTYKVVSDGLTYVAEVLASSPEKDIALMKADMHTGQYLRFAKNDPEKGESIYVIGYPGSDGKTAVSGIYDGTRVIGSEDVLYAAAYLKLKKGNSGSPVLNAKGEVTGIASAMYVFNEDIGLLIPADICLEYLKDYIFLP